MSIAWWHRFSAPTGPPAQHRSRPPEARTTLRPRPGSRPGPHPSCAGGQRTRNRGRTADGTGELPGHAGTDHLDRVQSTASSNAIAERWIGGCRRELLDRSLIWNQAHLRRLLSDYETHHNQHRTHRSLPGATPLKALPEPADLTHYRVRRHARVAGLIHEYQLVA
jgi:putative transposase